MVLVLLAKITLPDCLDEDTMNHKKGSESLILTSQKFYLSYSSSQQV